MPENKKVNVKKKVKSKISKKNSVNKLIISKINLFDNPKINIKPLFLIIIEINSRLKPRDFLYISFITLILI